MGKKRLRKKYTSKGQREGADRSISKEIRRNRNPFEIHAAKMDAFLAGKKVYFTIPNGNPKETNKRYIRIEGSKLYGDWRTYRLYGKEGKPTNKTQATGEAE